MTDKAKPPVNELFAEAMKNYEQALKAGLKLQEEAGKCWSGLLAQSAGARDWQKQAGATLDEIFQTTQQRMAETMQYVEQNSRTSLALLKQATEVVQSTSVAEGQAKVQKLGQTWLEALQSNTQAMTQSNTKFMETWADFVKKGLTPAAS
jgi:hypothetical protein